MSGNFRGFSPVYFLPIEAASALDYAGAWVPVFVWNDAENAYSDKPLKGAHGLPVWKNRAALRTGAAGDRVEFVDVRIESEAEPIEVGHVLGVA